MVPLQLRHGPLERKKRASLHIARVGQPLHLLFAPQLLSMTLMPRSWYMTAVQSVATSATGVVCVVLQLYLWVLAHYLGGYKSLPVQTVPSGTGYLSLWWSTFLHDM